MIFLPTPGPIGIPFHLPRTAYSLGTFFFKAPSMNAPNTHAAMAATIAFQQAAPITAYEIIPPSGAIATPPSSTDKHPPKNEAVTDVPITLIGSLTTYGIAPSDIPQNPMIRLAGEACLSPLPNFCGNSHVHNAIITGGTIIPTMFAAINCSGTTKSAPDSIAVVNTANTA